jgi:hypothetical protein
MPRNNKARSALILALVVVTLIIIGIWQTYQAIQSLKQGNVHTAAKHAQFAAVGPKLLRVLTLNIQPDVKAWDSGLVLITKTSEALITSNKLLKSLLAPPGQEKTDAAAIQLSLANLSASLEITEHYVNESWFLRRFIDWPLREKQLQQTRAMLNIISTLLQGSHTYLVLFQNSQEIRATGGFMGTYALVTLNNGVLERLDIQDIYVPDGQFSGFVSAPPGVEEYLSSGKGLRLPDANWSPDFPTSAQQILPFFSLGGEKNIEGVIAINLPVAEELLRVTGPLFIPDYQVTVTPENFASVARSNRDEFFPGSQQKKHFMSAFFTKLKIALGEIDTDKQQQLAHILIDSAKQKNILFYSQDANVQKLFTELNVAGLVTIPENTDFYLYPVESNVGINKANQDINRTVTLDLNNTVATIKTTFVNGNKPPTTKNREGEADHLGYVNYQRYLLLPYTTIKSITVNDQPITEWDEEIITTSSGDQLKQVGFLITVPEESVAVAVVTVEYPSMGEDPQVFIEKQPGLVSTQYHLQ